MSRRPSDEKKRKPNFCSWRRLEVRLQAEHLAEVVGADLDRRLADLVRGDRHRMRRAARARGCRGRRTTACSCSASVRPREAAASDDDVVARASSRPRLGAPCALDHERAVATGADCERQRQRERARQRRRDAAPSSARERLEQRQRAGHRRCRRAARAAAERRSARRRAPRASDQSNAATVRSLARGASTSATASRPAAGRHRRQRAGRLDVERDQQHRRARRPAHWLAASSRPAPKLASNAVSAVLALVAAGGRCVQ